ncbi:MAG: heavy metal-binding domain-containing protein [Desulfuromonadales bacterium]|nr:heavy metal-binding domain-containing protein [Desulfuromonadales bacterium]
MQIKDHNKVTGFSGNEIFCLDKLGYRAGQLCLGNNVIAMGVGRGIGAGLSNLAGGEITEITKIVHDGRKMAYDRMMEEASRYGGVGLAGVSFDLINHVGNFEFIALGSTIHQPGMDQENMSFSTSANAQQLYCQLDSGFTPHSFVFGNVAYSIGVGGNIGGAFRGLKRGEVPQFTEIFDRTRHLALSRIKDEAKRANANSVIGIETSIMSLFGAQEMMMIGTASSHPLLEGYANDPVTSDLTNEELWNLVNIGYMPLQLVMGVSVYSLGFASGIASSIKSLVGGHIETLTELLYEAREKAFERVQNAAQECGADEVVGVKTYIYDLGRGLVEFMVIGTAVKKMEGASTHKDTLPPQAIIQDSDTFVDDTMGKSTTLNFNTKRTSATLMQKGPLSLIISIIVILFYLFIFIVLRHH